jgi:antibiotic biosynthesis monooxygenase (ABM) superfamily enzyme
MKPPSIHIRALITWLAIFPLVSIGFYTVIPMMGGLHPLLKVLVLTLLVVPVSVYLVVPNLMKIYFAVAKRQAASKS